MNESVQTPVNAGTPCTCSTPAPAVPTPRPASPTPAAPTAPTTGHPGAKSAKKRGGRNH
ncbi:MAG TPA: hypothetical protein VL527_11155 [Dongiaceae bacterium]|nr:hypothetical protein [Dongiaceae bacterium]